jgi:Protein of unknown function (DUF1203)
MSTAAFAISPIDAATAGRLRAGATIVRVADESPGYPCRQYLRDAEIGDEMVLVSHDPFAIVDTDSPYRCTSAVFLHRHDCSERLDPAPLPDQLTRRRLSVRAFDADAMMLDGRVVDGTDLDATIAELFAVDQVERLHVHNAGPGCFAAAIERR